jgi:hypothetical protein
MADVVLSDGREITFDLDCFTLEEYRELFNPGQPEEEADAVISRAAGVKLEDYHALKMSDWKRLMKAFFKKCRDPLADPN